MQRLPCTYSLPPKLALLSFQIVTVRLSGWLGRSNPSPKLDMIRHAFAIAPSRADAHARAAAFASEELHHEMRMHAAKRRLQLPPRGGGKSQIIPALIARRAVVRASICCGEYVTRVSASPVEHCCGEHSSASAQRPGTAIEVRRPRLSRLPLLETRQLGLRSAQMRRFVHCLPGSSLRDAVYFETSTRDLHVHLTASSDSRAGRLYHCVLLQVCTPTLICNCFFRLSEGRHHRTAHLNQARCNGVITNQNHTGVRCPGNSESLGTSSVHTNLRPGEVN